MGNARAMLASRVSVPLLRLSTQRALCTAAAEKMCRLHAVGYRAGTGMRQALSKAKHIDEKLQLKTRARAAKQQMYKHAGVDEAAADRVLAGAAILGVGAKLAFSMKRAIVLGGAGVVVYGAGSVYAPQVTARLRLTGGAAYEEAIAAGGKLMGGLKMGLEEPAVHRDPVTVSREMAAGETLQEQSSVQVTPMPDSDSPWLQPPTRTFEVSK